MDYRERMKEFESEPRLLQQQQEQKKADTARAKGLVRWAVVQLPTTLWTSQEIKPAGPATKNK